MGVVDDIHRDLERGLGVVAGAGGVAAQRKHRADLDGLVLRASLACKGERDRGGTQESDDMIEFHLSLRNDPPDCEAF